MNKVSPFQTEPLFHDDPWRMLVGCILCNRTRGETVRVVSRRLFKRFTCARDLHVGSHEQIFGIVKRCGFGEQKTENIQRMTAKWLQLHIEHTDRGWSGPHPWPSWDYFHVWNNLPGIGRYAAHSWALFIEGRRDVFVEDHLLVAWLKQTAQEVADA